MTGLNIENIILARRRNYRLLGVVAFCTSLLTLFSAKLLANQVIASDLSVNPKACLLLLLFTWIIVIMRFCRYNLVVVSASLRKLESQLAVLKSVREIWR